MRKLFTFLDTYLLHIGIIFLLFFVPLYPKLPSIQITNTWVYIRLEDFFIAAITFIWLIQVLRKKVKIAWNLGFPIILYWIAGLLSLLFSVIVLAPHLQNFFPHVAALSYFRRIEYMILFFVAVSTIRSTKDIRRYLIALCTAVGISVIYGVGQKYYLNLWAEFPHFFEKYSFCFPSFQTGNEEFAKGIPLCLPSDARITSTFGGHYDLAAYLVVVIPIFVTLIFVVKKWWLKLMVFIFSILSLILLILTASRISFIAYVIGVIATLIFIQRKKFILPVVFISIFFLMLLSQSTAKRFLDTIRIASLVTNSQGEVVGEEAGGIPDELKKKIAKNPLVVENIPTQSLPQGSSYIVLPQTKKATSSALVSSNLSPEEARRLKLKFGGIEISTVSGSFLIQKALVYDISYTTRFQGEWPTAWRAFQRNYLFGSGFSSITLASDNDFIRDLGETGMLGFGTFFFIFLILGIALKTAAKSVTDAISKAYLYGLAGGVIGLMINATFIDVFEASKVAETLWILLGIGGGILLFYHKAEFNYFPALKRIFTSYFLLSLYFLVIIGIVLLPSINNFFVADDFTWLHWAASTAPNKVSLYFTDATGFFYRPIPKLAVYGLYTIFSFQPQGYHIFILFLHFLTTVSVMFLGVRIFKSRFIGFLAAVLFALLPAHGEIVFWFSTLSTTFATLFIVLGLLAFIKWRDSKSIIWLSSFFILYILSLFSYEMSVVFPFLCLVTDLCITRPGKKPSTWIIYVPLLVLIPVYYWLRIYAHAASFGGDYSYNLAKLIPNIIGNYFGYFGFYIFGQQFLPYYTSLRENLRANVQMFTVAAVAILVILGAIWYVMRNKMKMVYTNTNVQIFVYGILFSFVSLLTFLGLGNMSERYGYLSSVGYVLTLMALFQGITQIFTKKQKIVQRVLLGMVIFLSVIYIYQITIQKQDWEKAGNITEKTLTEFRLDYEFIPHYSNLFIVNMPVKEKQAWVFPSGSFSDGMWFIYRDPTLHIVTVTTLDQAKQLKLQAQESTLVKNFIFKFDKNGQISEIKE